MTLVCLALDTYLTCDTRDLEDAKALLDELSA